MNSVNLVGRFARPPEARGQQGGVAEFTLAVDDYNSQTKQKEAQFIHCVAFAKLAGVIMQYATTGTQASVSGKLRERKWQAQDGSSRSTWQVVVNDFQMLGSRPQQQARGPINPPPLIDDDIDGGAGYDGGFFGG